MTETDPTTALERLDLRHDDLLAALDELAARVDAAMAAAGLRVDAAEPMVAGSAKPQADGGRMEGVKRKGRRSQATIKMT